MQKLMFIQAEFGNQVIREVQYDRQKVSQRNPGSKPKSEIRKQTRARQKSETKTKGCRIRYHFRLAYI